MQSQHLRSEDVLELASILEDRKEATPLHYSVLFHALRCELCRLRVNLIRLAIQSDQPEEAIIALDQQVCQLMETES